MDKLESALRILGQITIYILNALWQFTAFIIPLLWQATVYIITAIYKSFVWWVNKISSAPDRKTGCVWVFFGFSVIYFFGYIVFARTPDGRRYFASRDATSTAVAIAQATSDIATQNAPTHTPTHSPTSTSTSTPTLTPKPANTPPPTRTPEPLDVSFDDSVYSAPELVVDETTIGIHFAIEGLDSSVNRCEALGEGLIFRDSIPLNFSLVIADQQGTTIYTTDNLEGIESSRAGRDCHLIIPNETGITSREGFTNHTFTLSIYDGNKQLDSVQLYGDGSRHLADTKPSITSTPILSLVSANSSGINIRTGPGTNYPTIQTINQNDTAYATGFNTAQTWVQIQLPDSTIGWVSTTLVNIENEENLSTITNIPAPPPPPANQPTSAPPVAQPQPTAPPATICTCSGDTYNCSSFSSSSQAQACFNYCIQQGRGDIHRLDRDNDGLACEG